jgi:hypothetical protein
VSGGPAAGTEVPASMGKPLAGLDDRKSSQRARDLQAPEGGFPLEPPVSTGG